MSARDRDDLAPGPAADASSSSPSPSSSLVTLVSADGTRFEVPGIAAALSGLVRQLTEEDGAREDVPLDVEARTLSTLLEFCVRCAREPPLLPVATPLLSSDLHDCIPSWAAALVERLLPAELCEAVLAADYMQLDALLGPLCARVACEVRGKTPAQVRAAWRVKLDFSDAEEAQIEREGRWQEDVEDEDGNADDEGDEAGDVASTAVAAATEASAPATVPPQPCPAEQEDPLGRLFVACVGIVVAHDSGHFALDCWRLKDLCRETRGSSQLGDVGDMVRGGLERSGVAALWSEARSCRREPLGDEEGSTQLMRAAFANDLARVRQLFCLGCSNINAQDHFCRSALHFASAEGHEDVVRELLARGADVNVRSTSDATPLLQACLRGHAAVVRLLCNAPGIDLAARSGGRTPLAWALRMGHDDVEGLLRARGAS